MDLEKIRSNQFKTICQYSIPAIIAMVLSSMITIADGFFAGNYVGKEGIAAINIGLPIVYLYLGLGLMISVGGSSLASMRLGAGDKDQSNAIFNQTILTTIMVTIALSFVVLIFFQQIQNILHINGQVAVYFQEYYIIMLAELSILVINNTFGMFIRAEGNPQFFMKNSILNVLANIILDYLFAGRLHLGIKGIALASLISSSICFLFLLQYFFRSSSIYKFQKFTFARDILKRTIYTGASEFIGEISMSITMFGYNLVILKHIGVDGVAAFTIVGYIAFVFNMIILGFGQGICPLVSFTYGAEEKELARRIRRKTNASVLGIGILVIIVMLFLSDWYSSIFVKSELIKGLVQSGMTIFMLSFVFSGINTITTFYFTAIGRAMEAAVISSLRGLIILLICIFTLPVMFGMTGVWMVAPVTEVITIPICICFLIKQDAMINRNPKLDRQEGRATLENKRRVRVKPWG